MRISERINLIAAIASKLENEEWGLIDLSLRQFGFPFSDQWGGSKCDYVIAMIENGEDQILLDFATHFGILINETGKETLSSNLISNLIEEVGQQKALMIAVATGGPRIQNVNDEYQSRRVSIQGKLHELGIQNPNHFSDLWSWYGRWSDGSLPSYQSRGIYLGNLFQPLLDTLSSMLQHHTPELIEPTGWVRVDRSIDKVSQQLSNSKDEEDFQSTGLLCREIIISLAQAVYIPDLHNPNDDIAPSDTDAKRMLENFISIELSGGSNEELRRYVKNAYQLAVVLQHKRSANFREAALCVEATRSLVNIIALISGQRDP
jgi:hypothetical protein